MIFVFRSPLIGKRWPSRGFFGNVFYCSSYDGMLYGSTCGSMNGVYGIYGGFRNYSAISAWRH